MGLKDFLNFLFQFVWDQNLKISTSIFAVDNKMGNNEILRVLLCHLFFQLCKYLQWPKWNPTRICGFKSRLKIAKVSLNHFEI